MSIYIMNGDTFRNIYAKTEDPDKILKTAHVIISGRIRTIGNFEEIVMKKSSLIPSNQLLADIGSNDPVYFEREYRKELKEHYGFLANMVKASMKEKETIILLCSKSEWEIGYLQIISKVIEERFHYPVYNYKKVKTGKESSRSYNPEEVMKKVKKALKKDRITQLESKMNSVKGRSQILKELTEKEMRKILDSRNLYTDGMSKREMKELIRIYVLED